FRHRIVVGSPLLWYTDRCGPFAPPGVRRSGGNSMLRIAWLTLACVIGLGATSTIEAQVQTGSILVRVSDEQGAAVPGVTITLTSTALVAGTTTGVSDSGGAYRFPSLPPGIYTVTLELQGFQTV